MSSYAVHWTITSESCNSRKYSNSSDQKVIKNKVGLLNLSEMLGSVSEACKVMGYSTEMRRAELCHLKVEDIDSDRMVIHIRHGKRNRDRDVPLSPKLLQTPREYLALDAAENVSVPRDRTRLARR